MERRLSIWHLEIQRRRMDMNSLQDMTRLSSMSSREESIMAILITRVHSRQDKQLLTSTLILNILLLPEKCF